MTSAVASTMPSYGKEAGSGWPPPNSKSASATGRAGGAEAPQPIRARVDRRSSRRGFAGVVMGDSIRQLPVMARLSRYSRWDGTQAVPDLDADDLLSAMSDDLLADGDLWNALRRLFQRGAQNPQGGRMPGLQDLLKRFMQGMQQGLQSLTPEDLKRMREMMRDLNQMLRERAQGGEPDFQAFKDKWGQNFPGVDSLDQ